MKVHETFGPCQSSLVDEAQFQHKNLLVSFLKRSITKNYVTSLKTNASKEFGHGIKFSFPNILESSELSEDSDTSDDEVRFLLEFNVEKWQSSDAGLYQMMFSQRPMRQ